MAGKLKREKIHYILQFKSSEVLSKSKNNCILCQHLSMKYYNTKNVSILNGAGLQSSNNSITKEVFFLRNTKK